MYKTIVVIPARMGSTRLPRKPLLDLHGKPVLLRTILQAKKAAQIDEIFVATDSGEIADLCKKEGVRFVMTSPSCPNGTQRITEAMNSIKAKWVINIQGDEPFIDPRLVDEIASTLQTERWQMVSAMYPIQRWEDFHNPNTIKVVCDQHHCALYFSRSPIPFLRDENIPSQGSVPARKKLFAHIGVYGFSNNALLKYAQSKVTLIEEQEKLEQLRMLYLGEKIKMIQYDEPSIGINTPRDLEEARAIFLSKQRQNITRSNFTKK